MIIIEGANEASTVIQRMSSELVRSGYTLLSNYWVLVVVSAFLLLFLSGEPNMFKTIYLIFFFVFLVTYQVSFCRLSLVTIQQCNFVCTYVIVV